MKTNKHWAEFEREFNLKEQVTQRQVVIDMYNHFFLKMSAELKPIITAYRKIVGIDIYIPPQNPIDSRYEKRNREILIVNKDLCSQIINLKQRLGHCVCKKDTDEQ